MNQKEFIEKMQELLQKGKNNKNRLTREEVENFLLGMNLEEEKKMFVYKYLLENGIHVKGGSLLDGEEIECEDSDFISSYKEGLGLQRPDDFDADLAKRDDLINYYLPVACKLAEENIIPDMLMEDRVQEATMFLIEAVNDRPKKNVDEFIEFENIYC